jgi:hypothetical protein
MKAELRIPIKDYRRPSTHCRSRKSDSFSGARLCLKDQPQQAMFAGGLLRLVLRTQPRSLRNFKLGRCRTISDLALRRTAI